MHKEKALTPADFAALRADAELARDAASAMASGRRVAGGARYPTAAQLGAHAYIARENLAAQRSDGPATVEKALLSMNRKDDNESLQGQGGRHIDHSLEMFREGWQGAGGGRGHGGGGHSSQRGYKFDGDVAKLGAGDKLPVTDFELEMAHDAIRERLLTRFHTVRRAFRMIDEDNSGKVDKLEAVRILMMHNLPIREKTLSHLVTLMDRNGDGVDYDEFCNFLKAEDATDMLRYLQKGSTTPRSTPRK
jgi:hypothetical protein